MTASWHQRHHPGDRERPVTQGAQLTPMPQEETAGGSGRTLSGTHMDTESPRSGRTQGWTASSPRVFGLPAPWSHHAGAPSTGSWSSSSRSTSQSPGGKALFRLGH